MEAESEPACFLPLCCWAEGQGGYRTHTHTQTCMYENTQVCIHIRTNKCVLHTHLTVQVLQCVELKSAVVNLTLAVLPETYPHQQP